MNTELQRFFPAILAILFLVLLVGILISYAFLDVGFMSFIDYPSLTMTLGGGFLLTWTQFSIRDMKEAASSLIDRRSPKQDRFYRDYFWHCVIRNLLIIGALGNSIGIVQILGSLSSLDYLAASLAVSMLTFLYSIAFCLLLPIPALLMNRSSAITKKHCHETKVRRSLVPVSIGYILLSTLFLLAILLGSSILDFVDTPSLLLVFGSSLWVYLIAIKWRRLGFGLGIFISLALGYYLIQADHHPVLLGLIVLLWGTLFYGMKSKTGFLRKMPQGELLTVTLFLAGLCGGLIGISDIILNIQIPERIGPSAAFAIISGLYCLLIFMFLSNPMEDRDNLSQRKMQDFSISRSCWFFFPILTQGFVLFVMVVLLISINEDQYHSIERFLQTLPANIRVPMQMSGVWLMTLFLFILIFAAGLFIMLYKSYDRIQRTKEQLLRSEKMASLGQLVAGIAHEINNPSNFIKSNIPSLKEYLFGYKNIVDDIYERKEQLPNELRSLFDEAYRKADLDYAKDDVEKLIRSFDDGSNRIAQIVADLRQYSRVDESYRSVYDIHEAIDGSLNLLIHRYKEHVTIHKDYGDIPLLQCSPGQINQVFLNLLANAEQAIEGQGNVWITTYRDDDKAVVEIRDDGKGIPLDIQEKIFDPFYTTKSVGEGTGLGLSISYSIIEQHGGSIAVISEPGKGALFTLNLPIRP